jgi:hypothetical protein
MVLGWRFKPFSPKNVTERLVMTEIKEILMFCTLYSGVMLGALAYTLNVSAPLPQKIKRK